MIQTFADWLEHDVFGLDAVSQLRAAVNFFFYDTIKILIRTEGNVELYR